MVCCFVDKVMKFGEGSVQTVRVTGQKVGVWVVLHPRRTGKVKLNSLHRRAAKLLLPDKNSSTDEKMKALSILPLQKQLYFNKAVLMFKVNRRMTPSYIISLFTESNNRTNRYVLPKPRIDLYKTSLSFSGSTCWNSLPVVIKTVGTIKSFKRVLHQYLM